MKGFNEAGSISARRAHQITMLEMLKQIDRICRAHDIHYMLYAGSLLGAVRHQGFIPWDDDLDVVMPRPDYERFLEVAPQEIDASRYYVQREFTEHWPMFFSKLRKNDTACIERYVPRDLQTHMGVYIDVFPCDNLSDSKFLRSLQFLASKVVIARGLDRRGYATDNWVKKLFMLVCRIMPEHLCRRIVKLEAHNETAMVHCFLGSASKYEKSVFPRAWFTDIRQMQFEDSLFFVPTHYHDVLTVLYGDYMILPSEEERRCKIHADLVDLEHSFTQYANYQTTRKIAQYTRSIR